MIYSRWYPNRTLCEVLDEMRKCHETRNYSYLAGLIEEVQTFGNRMEAALTDKNDLKEMQERRQELKHELRNLQEEIKNAKEARSQAGNSQEIRPGETDDGSSSTGGSV